MFKLLCLFGQMHGHYHVPPTGRRNSLALWLAEQCAEARAGRLPRARLRQLGRLGIDFDAPGGVGRKWPGEHERRWEKHFAELVEFKRQHGHCMVGRRSKKWRGLCAWVNNQRQLAKAGRLRADRWRRLKALGLERGRSNHPWNSKFAALEAYRKRFGHCDVPCHWPANRALGHWVSDQRSRRNKGVLRADRRKRLDRLGFRWVAHFDRAAPPQSYREWIRAKDQRWDSMFAALVRYRRKHGHCNVRPTDGLGGRLYRWVMARRVEARKQRLRADRRRRLNAVGFLWQGYNPAWDNWDRKFAQLLAFRKHFGHCEVPGHWREDPLLGHWVSNQRSFRRKGLLRPERMARLNRIGFRWEARLRDDLEGIPRR